MSFKDTQSYKELQADWRWIHSMDPEAAAAADQWVKEHPEEWKELEHMLYYSEANFHKRVAPDTLEDVDIKQPLSEYPVAPTCSTYQGTQFLFRLFQQKRSA